MNAHSTMEPPGLALLRKPFTGDLVSKLPKETRAQIDARKTNKDLMVWKCGTCGGAHHKNAVHLDYVGHAALTDRLLDTDPEWSWEPVAFDAQGLPCLDKNGGLWIRLTVLGVTRLGYGDAEGKQGGNAVKEAIGDALRNAAMRFGAALDLWHKGDLHGDDAETEAEKPAATKPIAIAAKVVEQSSVGDGAINGAQLSKLKIMLDALKLTEVNWLRQFGSPKGAQLHQLPEAQFRAAVDDLEGRMAMAARQDSNRTAQTGDNFNIDDEVKF